MPIEQKDLTKLRTTFESDKKVRETTSNELELSNKNVENNKRYTQQTNDNLKRNDFNTEELLQNKI